MESIHVVYCSDNNYMLPTTVSAASAVFHARTLPIVVHLVEDGVPDEKYDEFAASLKRISHRVEVDRIKWNGNYDLSTIKAYHGGITAYLRIFLPELLHGVDFAIYADGDTLWLGDPAELLDLRDERLLFQASLNPLFPGEREQRGVAWWRQKGREMKPESYLCTGVMLLNLKKMRAEGFLREAYEVLVKYPDPPFADQDIFCLVGQGRSASLPWKWGVLSADHGGVDLTGPAVVHYAGDVPWRRDKVTRLFSDVQLIWFEFARTVLKVDYYRKWYSGWTRMWRRGLYLLLRSCRGVIGRCPRVHSRFRNLKGLTHREFAILKERFAAPALPEGGETT